MWRLVAACLCALSALLALPAPPFPAAPAPPALEEPPPLPPAGAALSPGPAPDGPGATAEEEAAVPVPEAYRDLVAQVAHAHGLRPALLAALVQVETAGTWDARLVGRDGELGLTQVLPATQGWLVRAGLAAPCDLREPRCSLETGAAYLAALLRQHGGDLTRALREYNGGPRWQAKPATALYASRVEALAGPGRPAPWEWRLAALDSALARRA